MPYVPYPGAVTPVQIAHAVITEGPRDLSAAEQAAHDAITEAIEQAGASECLAEGILARAAIAAALPHLVDGVFAAVATKQAASNPTGGSR